MSIHHWSALSAFLLAMPCLCAQAEPGAILPTEVLQRRAAAQDAMCDLIAVLRDIRTTGQVAPYLTALATAVEHYHKQIAPVMEREIADFPPVTEDSLDFHERNRALFRRSRDQQAELSHLLDVDFISMLYDNELLCYHLLLHSPYLELPLSEQCRELLTMHLTMHLAMTAPPELELQQPQAVLDRFAEAAERHADFQRAHANRYSGGDGSGADSAILLHLEEEAAKNEQDEMQLIRAYLSTVYPDSCTTYVTCMALLDGTVYITPVRFLGLYTAPDGSQQLLRQVIWFRAAK